MNAHNVDPDALDGLGLLHGWDYFLEESLSLRGDPPARSFTPEAPPTQPPLEDILDPEGTYTDKAPREDGPEDLPPVQPTSPAKSSSSSSTSRHSSDYESDDEHGGKRWREEPDMTDPPPNPYDEAGIPPVGKYFITFLSCIWLNRTKFKIGLTGKRTRLRSCEDPRD
jgi:hypothetical protein